MDDFEELYDEGVDREPVEAYCMTCRQKTPMNDPAPIWTRRGAPGTRGTCAICGTTVFVMGRTAAHDRLRQPAPVHVADAPPGKNRSRLPAATTYLNYSVPDAEFAEILAEDLKRAGIQTWLAGTEVDDVRWATGVHPALVECANMIVVLTPLAIRATHVADALQYFLGARKPVFVVQLGPGHVPDELRRKPRFDFSGDDYKQRLRELIQALSG